MQCGVIYKSRTRKEINMDIVSVRGIGSHKRETKYYIDRDLVICGCFKGTLEEFKAKLEMVYGGSWFPSHKRYYAEYMAAIEFFEKCRKAATDFEQRNRI